MRTLGSLPLALVLLASACSVAPAARSPLKEKLDKAEMPDVETAVRSCLKEGGWKVDDVGSYSGGANVVTAYKAKDQTDVYIYGADQHPRITGGPDDQPFWKCVARSLGGGGGDDKGDKDKGDRDKPDKGDKADDKGAAPSN